MAHPNDNSDSVAFSLLAHHLDLHPGQSHCLPFCINEQKGLGDFNSASVCFRGTFPSENHAECVVKPSPQKADKYLP